MTTKLGSGFSRGPLSTQVRPVTPVADMKYSWHQDVKPKNILLHRKGASSPYDSRFKLADLGLSHFIRVASAEVEGEASDSMGTRTYGESFNSSMI